MRYTVNPPSRLVTRLRAFGSQEAFDAFQTAETTTWPVPVTIIDDRKGDFLTVGDFHKQPTAAALKRTPHAIGPLRPQFVRRYDLFVSQVRQFEMIVHDELT